MPDLYDVIVLGAGSTGTNVAWYARDNALSVAVIERELVGGECSYWACIPSKALLGPSSALAAARRLPGASAAVTGELDVDAVLAGGTASSPAWTTTVRRAGSRASVLTCCAAPVGWSASGRWR